MKPWIFQGHLPLLGEVAVPGYYFWLTVALLLATSVAVREARRSGVPVARILDLMLFVVVGGLVGGRLGHILFENPQAYLANPLRVLQFWKGGLVFYGGFLFCMAFFTAYVWFRKMDFWRTADVIAPAGAMSLAIGRLGCFSAGCCYGKPIDFPLGWPLPWGVTYFSGQVPHALEGIPLHPTQLYSSMLAVVWFLWVMRVKRNARYDGQAFLHLVVLYTVGRSVVELFRFDLERGVYWGWISTSQMISVPLIIAALVGMRMLSRRRPTEGEA